MTKKIFFDDFPAQYNAFKMAKFKQDLELAFNNTDKPLRNFQIGDTATIPYDATYDVLLVSYTSTGAAAVALPPVDKMKGRTIEIKDSGLAATTHHITVTPDGTDKIDGASSYSIALNGKAVRLYSDGVDWHNMSV